MATDSQAIDTTISKIRAIASGAGDSGFLSGLKELDQVTLNFSGGDLFVLNLTIAIIMFGVALEIKVDHFKNIWNNKRVAVIGVVSQFVVLPLATFLLAIALGDFITPTIAMGMILVASCPGGNISNFISALAKGHAALSVTLTAIATTAAIALTPLNFKLWGGLYTNISVDASSYLKDLDIPVMEVFKTVIILLGIPLLSGMLFNSFFPKLTKKITKPIKIFSIVAFSAMVIIAFSNNFEYFKEYIKYIFILVLIHNAIALGSGYIFARLTKCNDAVRRTITIETGIQNSVLALVLLFNPKIFPPEMNNGGMAFIAAWWGIWHILSGLGIAFVWSRRAPKGGISAA
ncbi:MAG: bile acid:sodium symporter family protein [Bacteroidales bacterium]|nr:bile acid:sodium symporter family protein [Bacteroidales bacterium]